MRLVAALEALRREAAEVPATSADIEAEAARAFAKADRAMKTALAELDKTPPDAAGKLRFLDMQVKV